MREALRRLVSWRRDTKKIPVMALTSDGRDRDSLTAFAVRGDWELVVAASLEEALASVRESRTAVVLCDRDLPGLDWRDALEKLAASNPACAIILTSAVNDEYLWDEVIHRGGYDVLAKPLQQEQTVRAVNLAWSYSRERARA